jgi:hypothetical protein
MFSSNHLELREQLASVDIVMSNVETRTESISREVASVREDVSLLRRSSAVVSDKLWPSHGSEGSGSI